MVEKEILEKESEAFDKQVDERIKQGFVPDLRRLKKVDWFYNNMWRDPEFANIILKPYLDFILNITKNNGGKVIELGCGHGYLTLELARNNLDVIGLDLSPKSIEIARKFAEENPFKETFGSLEYQCADILSMDLGKDKYDTILFFGTLHHIQDIDYLLEKCNKALKKGGNLIVCEPIRGNFTRKSAEFAAIFRAILPTWIPYDKKLNDLNNSENWEKYVNDIYKEYTYDDEHEQSPCDNSIASEKVMVESIEKYFTIKEIQSGGAFIYNIIGGIRGENKYHLARFMDFLDKEMVKNKTLKPISIRIHAIKD